MARLPTATMLPLFDSYPRTELAGNLRSLARPRKYFHRDEFLEYEGWLALIKHMREERSAAYIFVNNRLEGNAPDTIRAVIAE